VLDRLLERLRRKRLVAERAAGQARQLPVVTVGEDREVLSPAGEVVSQAGAGQRVGNGIRGEARPTLLPVGDDRRAGRLASGDGVQNGLVLLGLELILGDLPGVVLGVGRLQLGRAG